MNYKDYKRHVKLAEVLDKPLKGKYSIMDNYVKYLHSLKREYRNYDYVNQVDFSFIDSYDNFIIIQSMYYHAEISDRNFPRYLFKNEDEVDRFLTEFINSELIDEKKDKIINIAVNYRTHL